MARLQHTIDSVVREALFDRGLPIHFYARALAFGLRFLREAELDYLGIVEAISLPVELNAAAMPFVNLPAQAIAIQRYGQIRCGVFSALGHDPLPMATPKQGPLDPASSPFEYHGLHDLGYNTDHAYVDWVPGVGDQVSCATSFYRPGSTDIFLGSGFAEGDHIYLEYVTERPSAKASIPAAAVDAMRLYIHWQLVDKAASRMQGDRQARLSLVATARQEYVLAKKKMILRLSPVKPAMVLRHLDRFRHQSLRF